jgi:hypothetical protein
MRWRVGYPNSDQRLVLVRIPEIHHQVYNVALRERRYTWKRYGLSMCN